MNARTKLYAGLALAAAAGTALLARRAYTGKAGRKKPIRPLRDYSNRSGFPRPASEMRGLARTRPAVTSTAPVTHATDRRR
jgi:hypothetical protein